MEDYFTPPPGGYATYPLGDTRHLGPKRRKRKDGKTIGQAMNDACLKLQEARRKLNKA